MTRAHRSGASRTRRRRLTIGSSTAPTVLESRWPSMTDISVRIRVREPKPVRGRSRVAARRRFPLRRRLRAPPRPGARPDRGRRVASRAPSSEPIPSARNRSKMPGAATSAAGAPGRFRRHGRLDLSVSQPQFVIDARRASASCFRRNDDLQRRRNRAIAPPIST